MHVKSRTLRPLLAALALAVGSVTALTATSGSAQADAQVCDQFGSVTTPGGYVVQNNAWGTSAPQCVTQVGDGFQLTRADGSVPTNGAPKSYPSIFAGCHYTNCSPGTSLPKRIGSIGSVPTSIAYQYVGGAVYDAAYDIWLDPTPKTDGVNKTEIMIWLNRTGPIQPIGSVTGTVSQGLATPDWYLTSVQAGFEPWENGTGLAVTSFSVGVN